MGVVYRARQRSLNRRVALKVLPPALAGDPVALARFRREIAALARADHPNLVKILTSGSDGDRHYYAMELVEGTSLADLQEVLRRWRARAGRALRESDLPPAISTTSEMAEKRRKLSSGKGVTEGGAGGLPELERLEPGPPPAVGEGQALHDRLAALFADAAEALAHLHARGILHRDVKPGNLMLTAGGERIVVMDLGLAQLRDRSQSLTRTGTRWVGTLRYAAPEQLQWNLLDVDERADVYGLGASLYELVTLNPLFDGDTEPRLIEQVLHQEPRLPRKLDPTVPRDLEAVLCGCLEKDRSAPLRERPRPGGGPRAGREGDSGPGAAGDGSPAALALEQAQSGPGGGGRPGRPGRPGRAAGSRPVCRGAEPERARPPAAPGRERPRPRSTPL